MVHRIIPIVSRCSMRSFLTWYDNIFVCTLPKNNSEINNFVGSIPSEIGLLTNMHYLWLGKWFTSSIIVVFYLEVIIITSLFFWQTKYILCFYLKQIFDSNLLFDEILQTTMISLVPFQPKSVCWQTFEEYGWVSGV